jgi:hypothetical protein
MNKEKVFSGEETFCLVPTKVLSFGQNCSAVLSVEKTSSKGPLTHLKPVFFSIFVTGQ